MRLSRFTDQQIVFALQQAQQGTQVGEVTRKMGISEQLSSLWKEKYGVRVPSEVRKSRHGEKRTPGSKGRWRA